MSLGIIGGPDGPTAVFTNLHPAHIAVSILLGAATGAAFYFIRRNHRKH